MDTLLFNIILSVFCIVVSGGIVTYYFIRRLAVLHKMIGEVSPDIYINVSGSCHIRLVATAAIELAVFSGARVHFDFSGYRTMVDLNSCPHCIEQDYKDFRTRRPDYI